VLEIFYEKRGDNLVVGKNDVVKTQRDEPITDPMAATEEVQDFGRLL